VLLVSGFCLRLGVGWQTRDGTRRARNGIARCTGHTASLYEVTFDSTNVINKALDESCSM
jgi:hypothetical protein